MYNHKLLRKLADDATDNATNTDNANTNDNAANNPENNTLSVIDIDMDSVVCKMLSNYSEKIEEITKDLEDEDKEILLQFVNADSVQSLPADLQDTYFLGLTSDRIDINDVRTIGLHEALNELYPEVVQQEIQALTANNSELINQWEQAYLYPLLDLLDDKLLAIIEQKASELLDAMTRNEEN